MNIGGLQAVTLLDFPGKVACTIFTQGCNFRCHYCHNPEFVLPELIKNNQKNLISEKSFFAFLEKRK
jgi:pyruvate formate lyase activating enzyme